MKTCSRCKRSLPLSEFNKKAEGHQPYCRPCDRLRSREYYQKNHKKQKAQIQAARARRRARLKEEVDRIKSIPCMDCHEEFPPYVMDFDHRGDKEFTISHAVNAQVLNIKKILKEIEKCDIVCSNCHRIRTHLRRHGGS